MRLILWNIYLGAPQTWDDCHQWLQQQAPDSLVLNECNNWTARSTAERMQAVGLPHSHLTEAKRTGCHLAYAAKDPFEIVAELDAPFWHAALHVRHEHYDIILTHLCPEMDAERKAIRLQEAEAIIAQTADSNRPVFFCADCNDVSPADASWLAERDHQESIPEESAVAKLLQAGFKDLDDGREPRISFPTELNQTGWHRRYDFILLKQPQTGITGVSRIHQEPPLPTASDHFPVVADCELL